MTSNNSNYNINIGSHPIEYFQIFEIENPGTNNIKGSLIFTVNINICRKFEHLDLKDEVVVYLDKNKVFTGYISGVCYNNNFAIFYCEGYRRDFHSLISFDPLNISPEKTLYYITRTLFPKEKIQLPEIMKEKMGLIEQDYIVIIPIDNFIMDNKNLSLFDYQISGVLEDDQLELLKTSMGLGKDKIWTDNIAKVRVIVRADNFFDAATKGLDKVSKLVDFIAFKNDLSFTNLKNEDRENFKNSIFYSKIDLIPKILCIEKNSNYAGIFDLKLRNRKPLKINDIPEKYFLSLQSLQNILFKEDNLTILTNLVSLSIHWLRLAIYAEDQITKLINLWTSLEFAINGLKPNKKFSSEEIESIKEQLREIKINNYHLNYDQIEILESKIDKLNDAPLMATVKSFLEDNNIPFDDTEYRIIKQLRMKRNDIQHGKSNVTIQEEELQKLRTLIERILILRLDKSI